MLELVGSTQGSLSVAIIGVGTVGCNILNKIEKIYSDKNYIDFLYVHSSGNFLTEKTSNEDCKIELKQHIHFYESEIKNRASGKDIVFLVSALGGETGSTISPFIAKMVTNNTLCVGLFSFPFGFEGKHKNAKARKAYKAIRSQIDSLVCIENDSFLEANLKNQSLTDINNLFSDSNEHFIAVIRGIVELLYAPGMINVDFADLKTVISRMGLCTVAYSTQRGDQRADVAIKNLLTSPALKNRDISKALGWIINITAGIDLSLEEYSIVGSNVEDLCSSDATVVVGTCINPKLIGDMQVTAIVTGLPDFLHHETLDDDNESYDFVTFSKSIEFEPHHVSAGLSILTYFNEFVRQKYLGTATKVRIEQNNTSVILIIETPSGEVELIEKSLKEFGMVVVGELQASEVLERDMDIERLKMKLEMAAMELRHNEKILFLYKSENDSNKIRITALEDQLKDLQKTINKSLSAAQSHISKQINSQKGIPSEIVKLINGNQDKELTENLKKIIEVEINKHKNDKSVLLSIKKLVENSVYGVTGNSLYTFILHVINNLPK